MLASTVHVNRAVAVIDDVIGVIRGYVAIWGVPIKPDAYGTYFSKERPPEMGIDRGMHRRPILYEHTRDGVFKKEIVGVIDKVWFDDIGIAFEGHLDRSLNGFQRLIDEIRNEELKTSSATMQHTAEFDPDGAFRTWILGELSLTKNPAEFDMPAVQLIRSTAEAQPDVASGDTQDIEQPTQHEETTNMDMPQEQSRNANEMVKQMMDTGYSLEEIMQAVQAMMGQQETMSAPEPARSLIPQLRAALESQIAEQRKDNRVAELENQLNALRSEIQARQNEPPDKSNDRFVRNAPQISVSEPRKYWHLEHSDMMFAYQMMRSRGIQPSADFMQVFGGRTGDAVEKNAPIMQDKLVRSLLPSTRANEVATSTASGGGDEWVSIAWSSDIWEVARNNRVYQQLVSKGMRVVEVPQGAESTYITTEGADPTVYTISQDTDLAASGRPDVNVGATRIGTGRVLLTPGELGMAVVYSDVFQEDSIINVAAQYNQQMREKAEETIEQLFINGDTDTSANTNINLIDGTPGTGLSVPYYIASNGALKYALVTGSNTSRDGGSLDENDYRLTLKLMTSAIRTRKQNLAFVIDPDTHSASLDIAAIKTEDVKRTNATITSGMLTNMYGVDVLESGFMPLANSAGKVPAAGGTLGRILCIYAPYWAVGTKRQITIETDRDVWSGTNVIVAKMRIGFVPRGAGASVCTYNLTV